MLSSEDSGLLRQLQGLQSLYMFQVKLKHVRAWIDHQGFSGLVFFFFFAAINQRKQLHCFHIAQQTDL